GACVVVDFGTSTNFDVVSERGEFLGGALAPGIEISVDALAARGARLFKIELVRPRSVIGKSTMEALQSGILYGFAGQIDGLVRRIIAELGGVVAVVAAGGRVASGSWWLLGGWPRWCSASARPSSTTSRTSPWSGCGWSTRRTCRDVPHSGRRPRDRPAAPGTAAAGEAVRHRPARRGVLSLPGRP